MAYPADLPPAKDYAGLTNADKLNGDGAGYIHTDEHQLAWDTLAALCDKVGVDSSAVTSSIDYLLKNPLSLNPGHRHTAAHISDLLTTARTYSARQSYVTGTLTATGSNIDAWSFSTSDTYNFTSGAASTTYAIPFPSTVTNGYATIHVTEPSGGGTKLDFSGSSNYVLGGSLAFITGPSSGKITYYLKGRPDGKIEVEARQYSA